jgi:transposase
VYEQRKRALLVRITGGPPLSATVYERQQLRCNLCGEVYTAPLPENVPEEKYDAPAAAMIALLKYGSGLPFNRLASLQGSLGVPLSASTQWEIVRDAARALEGVYEALIDEAAAGEVLHNDDTSMPVLALRSSAPEPEEGIDPERTGVFTSGIVSTKEGRRIALFFTGRRHAGENLAQVLSRRAAELSAPLSMSDALSRNLPKEFEVIAGHCLVHGRRNFVKLVESFPGECRHVLEELAKVYRVEARARGLSPEERLDLHQRESGPVLAALKGWFDAALAERRVEPNSGLGQAIRYMTKRWETLTRFLRILGAPLDNNICERALKKAILHRKNALFYKTPRGARTGDIFQSLIHTIELAGGNPFEYLTALLGHRAEVEREPAAWLPWTYAAALARAASPASG